MRLASTWLLLLVLGASACTGVTETNVMPLPCENDAQCGGDGLRCLPSDASAPDGGRALGRCETRP